jgi:hypothetical protein
MNGFWERVTFAFRCFFSILFHAHIPDDIVQKQVKPAGPVPQVSGAKVQPAVEASDRAVQMLALLQRDGRLIDFLEENISAYPEEDQPVTLQAGFDPAAIKLIGNVRGEAPVRGVLRHKGWRVKEVNLPPLPRGGGRMVVAPAEVELS